MDAGPVTGTAATNLLVSALGSIAGLLLARYLGPSARGALVIAVTWPMFIGTVGNLGLPQATTYWSARNPQAASKYLVSGTLLSLVISIPLAGIGWFASPLISDSKEIVDNLRRLFLAMPLYFLPGVWVGSLQAARISWWNMARLVQPLVYLPYVVVLQVSDSLTVRSAVDAYLVSLLVQNIATATVAYKVVGLERVGSPEVGELWRYGVRSVTSNLPSLVNSRFDQLVLSLSVSTAALGNYALAVSLSSLAIPAASAFGSVAFPRMAAASKGDRAGVRSRAMSGGIVTAAAFAIPIALLGPTVIPLAFGPGYEKAAVCLFVLAPAAVVLVSNQISEDLLRGEGRPLVPAGAELLGSLLTFGLLLLFVPYIGILGAALASILSYLTVAALLLFARKRVGTQSDDDRPWEVGR